MKLNKQLLLSEGSNQVKEYDILPRLSKELRRLDSNHMSSLTSHQKNETTLSVYLTPVRTVVIKTNAVESMANTNPHLLLAGMQTTPATVAIQKLRANLLQESYTTDCPPKELQDDVTGRNTADQSLLSPQSRLLCYGDNLSIRQQRDRERKCGTYTWQNLFWYKE